MMPENKRCLGCMKDIGGNTVCPYCGYIEGTPYLPAYLKPGTVLKDRYLVGKLLSYNGEGATYIAFDQSLESIVELREYLPDTLANRAEDGETVYIIAGCEAQYKALMSDFIELSNALSKFRTLTHLIQVYEVFEDNNTVYAIHEHIDGGITLRQYLMESAGELSWEETARMFTPLMNTLSVLHGSNLIHRGISPETILVTKRNELKLDGFCISAIRAVKTELSSQLFSGYAAPEQYSASSWHGPWTDVYSLAAVFYKVLTGTMPPEAMSRSINDNLLEPHTLNPNVPKHVSMAIMEGLRLSPDNRIQTMQEFSSQLLRPVHTFAEPVDVQRQAEKEDEEEDSSPKRHYWLIATGVTGGILVVVAVLLIMFVLGGNGDSDAESGSMISIPSAASSKVVSQGEDKPFSMPSLIGQVYESVKINEDYTSLLDITVKEEYNETYAEGIIFEQSISEGTPIAAKTKVTLTVSLGTKFPRIPDYFGMKKEQYIAELERRKIKYKLEFVEEPGRDNGYVHHLDREANTTIDITGSEVLTVYIIQNPESSEPSSAVSSEDTSSMDIVFPGDYY